jgi:hypothetical protein
MTKRLIVALSLALAATGGAGWSGMFAGWSG